MRALPRERRLVALAAAVSLLLLLRWPFAAPSIDDLDSANFHAGVGDFSPVAHRPHPPGFPVFIAAAKVVNGVTGDALSALTTLSALAGALTCLPVFVIARRTLGRRQAMATAVACCSTPIVWFVAVRPMSDAFGLLVGLTAIALMLSGLDRRAPGADRWWMAGTAVAGLAVGVRLQLGVLVLPLLLFGVVWHRRRPVTSVLLVAAAIASWLLPTVWLSGGADAYLTAFRRTMAEAARWEPLFSRPSGPRVVRGMYDVLVRPWINPWLASATLLFAALGVAHLARRRPGGVVLLGLAFLPYAIFTFGILHTEATRYTVPYLLLVVALSIRGFEYTRRVATALPMILTTAYVAASAAVTMPALAAYGREPSPAVRALGRTGAPDDTVLVSGSRVFERYVAFAPPGVQVLSPASGNGWVRAAKYWGDGGTAAVDFLMMTGESLRGLVAPEAVHDMGRWRWAPSVAPFMTGERPNDVYRVRVTPPSWVLPRARTPSARTTYLPVFVRRGSGPRHVLVLGRGDSDYDQKFSLLVDRDVRDRQVNVRDFFLQTAIDDDAPYTEIVVQAWTSFQISRVLVADVAEARLQPIRGLRRAAPDEGDFHRLDPVVTLAAHVPPAGATLRMQGQVLDAARSAGATLTVRWNGSAVATTALDSAPFVLTTTLLPEGTAWSSLSLETSRHGQPATVDVQLTDFALEHAAPVAPPRASASLASPRSASPNELARR